MSQAPFRLPGWASKPRNADTQVRVMKEGTLVKTVPLTDKALLFGRKVPDAPERGTLRCEHDSISREHAVIAHSFAGEAFVIDLGSRFGTTLDGEKIEPRKYLPIAHGAKLRFGESTREYVYLTRAPADASSGAPTLAGASGASGAPKPKARASVDSDDEDPMAAYVDEEDAAAEAAEGAGAARAERKTAKERERARRKEAKAESKLARKEERREEKQRVKEARAVPRPSSSARVTAFWRARRRRSTSERRQRSASGKR